MTCSIASLPDDLLPEIFKHIPADLSSVALVCARWHKASRQIRLVILKDRLDNSPKLVEKIFILIRLSQLSCKVFMADFSKNSTDTLQEKMEKTQNYVHKCQPLILLSEELKQQIDAANAALLRAINMAV